MNHVKCHLYPVSGNGVWQKTIDRIRSGGTEFDGRRVLAVCTADPGRSWHRLDPPDAVRDYANGWFHEVLEVPNDPELGEVASWAAIRAALLPCVRRGDAVFYCHSKGATYADPGHPSRRYWAEAMFRACLSRPELIAEHMSAFDITGPFKTNVAAFGRHGGSWHYAGTFFWVAGRAYLSRRDIDPPRRWAGVEAWPGIAFPKQAAGCLFCERSGLTPDPYSLADWERLWQRLEAEFPRSEATYAIGGRA